MSKNGNGVNFKVIEGEIKPMKKSLNFNMMQMYCISVDKVKLFKVIV